MRRVNEDDPSCVCCRVSGPCGHRVDLAREVVDVYLHLVEARCRHRQAYQPVDPNHAAAARREGKRVEETARAHVARSAFVRWQTSHNRT